MSRNFVYIQDSVISAAVNSSYLPIVTKVVVSGQHLYAAIYVEELEAFAFFFFPVYISLA